VKILLAPSKTMTASPKSPPVQPLFFSQKNHLLEIITSYSLKELEALYDVSKPIALENKKRFEDFQEKHEAYHAYTGYMFKMMAKETLPLEAETYLRNHLLIVSGLYGLVRMNDTIGLYRLPMGVSLEKPLAQFWKKELTHALQGEWVVDLLSQEYRDAFNVDALNLTTIDFVQFKNKKPSRPAMVLKKCRGLMVKAMALHNIQTKEALKTLVIDGFTYDEAASHNSLMVFQKDV